MIDRSSGYSIVVECSKCGWGWATTTYDPTIDDDTSYEIWLMPGNPQTIEVIRLIAGIANVSYLQAKKMLGDEAPVMLYKAYNEAVASQTKVQKIQDIAGRLAGANVKFSIKPDFPYNI